MTLACIEGAGVVWFFFSQMECATLLLCCLCRSSYHRCPRVWDGIVSGDDEVEGDRVVRWLREVGRGSTRALDPFLSHHAACAV